jgi:PAS domain S-box-containing protein
LAGLTDAFAFETEQRRAEELARLDRAKTDFFTNISHEFRTPLTLLLGPAEDALADPVDPLPERQRERVEVMHRNGQRLLKLVNTLLDFSRLESGRADGVFEPVDLARYTRELASMFETAADRLGLALTIDCPPLPQPVLVDRDMWGKIVLNLVSNALKFTLEGGVAVRLLADGDRAVLRVSDTGAGIPVEEQDHLFERFHRVSGVESRSHEGSGIGLALVAELAELHGGTVSVTSAPGAGSTFEVRVPLGAGHLPDDRVSEPTDRGVTQQVLDGFLSEVTHLLAGGEDSRDVAEGGRVGAEVAGTPADGTAATRDRPVVLVVDDNADIRSYVAGLLAADHEVRTAADGAAGLELALADPPDLVLTDVMMPRLDGFGLLAALRADPATVDVPVVMLSARAGEEGTLEGLEAGADDYLAKPFSARELQARVSANLELDRARRTREHLERSQALLDQAQRLARVGSWEVHLPTGRVRTSDEYRRIVGLDDEAAERLHFPEMVADLVHPDDLAAVLEALADRSPGADIAYEARVLHPDGTAVLVTVHGEVVLDDDGEPVSLRGSVQDITEQRATEDALARARAAAEAAAREHSIADELQRSLLPELAFDLEHLEVATYYRAGVEGTQVGGDWYDVIELGGGRTALVVGDVMGRGVRAAAVMGQLRAAVRAYARLDLAPADLLEYLDGIVRDLGEDQIVTCIYAVFDPSDLTLRYANAGHLPPLVADPVGGVRLLTGAEEPPLGAGPVTMQERAAVLPPGASVVLYTDGLVERRGEDLEEGLESLRRLAASLDGPLESAPTALVHGRLPHGPDDDVAILVARVVAPDTDHGLREVFHGSAEDSVAAARHVVARHLREIGIEGSVLDDAVLVTSELVTNAVLHAAPPYELRVSGDEAELRLEVHDTATYVPRKQRPGPRDEHGRGLQIVASLADRWGTRPTDAGKAVWCVLSRS